MNRFIAVAIRISVGLTSVIALGACGKSDGNANQAPNDGRAGVENRTALSMFYGDYQTVSIDGQAVVGSYDDETTLTCDTNTAVGNASIRQVSESSSTVLPIFSDAQTGAVIKTDQVWVSPGILNFDSGMACTFYEMYVFADRGHWRMGDNFAEYTFEGAVMKDGVSTMYNDYLHIERQADGQLKIDMNVDSSADGKFGASFMVAPKQ